MDNNSIGFYSISKASEKKIEDKSVTQGKSPRRRKHVNYRKSERHISGITSSDSDFETDGTEVEYLPSIQNSGVSKRGLRGFLAHQATSRKKRIPGIPSKFEYCWQLNCFECCKNRGQTFGRRRKIRGRRYSRSSDRIQMLEEHRRIVENLNEEQLGLSNDDSANLELNWPVLSQGSLMKDFCCE